MTNISHSRLKYLHTAVQSGSMRAAAEKLNVAPSSISRQIARLEDELGLPLIERGRRRIKLTEAGELALRYFRDQQSQQETFVSELDDLRGVRRGNVVLAVGEAFVSDRFSTALTGFHRAYPGIKIKITIAGTNEVMSLVVADDAHIGMVFETPPDPKIRVRTSLPQPIRAVVAPGHALAGKKQVTLRELGRHRLGLPRRSFRIRQVLEQVEAEQQIYLTPSLTTNSLGMLREFARSGEGVTLLPELAFSSELRSGDLVAIEILDDIANATSAETITRLGRRLPVAAAHMLHILDAYLLDR